MTLKVASFHDGARKYVSILMHGVISLIGAMSYGPCRKKTCLRGVANNTDADQPVHQCSLISAFVVCFLKSSIC